MAIGLGQNPEHDPSVIKFIAKSGDGCRGVVLALKKRKKEAVVLSMTASAHGDVEWGRIYRIKEKDPEEWPGVVESIDRIPNDWQWTIITCEQPEA